MWQPFVIGLCYKCLPIRTSDHGANRRPRLVRLGAGSSVDAEVVQVGTPGDGDKLMSLARIRNRGRVNAPSEMGSPQLFSSVSVQRYEQIVFSSTASENEAAGGGQDARRFCP